MVDGPGLFDAATRHLPWWLKAPLGWAVDAYGWAQAEPTLALVLGGLLAVLVLVLAALAGLVARQLRRARRPDARHPEHWARTPPRHLR